jgi:pimeloyl-ACP methyl ester carboxylesterase
MPFANRGSSRIWFETIGDARNPPVLMIMGLAVSSRAWDRLPRILAEDHYVIIFDNRGTGRSTKRGFAYRMRDLADDAAAVLDAAGVTQADVFGISMGGMVAQELVLRHPERVRRLALGATFGSFRHGHRAPLRSVWDLILLNLGFDSAARLARLLLSEEWHARHPGRGVEWIRSAEPTGFRYALAQSAAVMCHHTGSRLRQVKSPTLVITGDADRLVPPANSEWLARTIPGAKYKVLQGAGHVFPLEREAETVAALRAHFSNGH